MYGPPTPTGHHNVPDDYIEEKGGYGEKLKPEGGIRKVIQDDEEILLLIAQWLASNNN